MNKHREIKPGDRVEMYGRVGTADHVECSYGPEIQVVVGVRWDDAQGFVFRYAERELRLIETPSASPFSLEQVLAGLEQRVVRARRDLEARTGFKATTVVLGEAFARELQVLGLDAPALCYEPANAYADRFGMVADFGLLGTTGLRVVAPVSPDRAPTAPAPKIALPERRKGNRRWSSGRRRGGRGYAGKDRRREELPGHVGRRNGAAGNRRKS